MNSSMSGYSAVTPMKTYPSMRRSITAVGGAGNTDKFTEPSIAGAAGIFCAQVLTKTTNQSPSNMRHDGTASVR